MPCEEPSVPLQGPQGTAPPPVAPAILFPEQRVHGTLIARLNRFAALALVGGREVVAHVPNSGRMLELMVPGHEVVLVEHASALRKTAFDLLLVRYRGNWVSVDSRLPGALAYRALLSNGLAPWQGATQVRREVVYRDSRLDLELQHAGRRTLIETKSVNLVEDGLALFPDAPTLRGTRHLRTLMQAAAEGLGAGALFIIQRADAERLRPFDAADPNFGRALREAAAWGVALHAYRCTVTPEAMALDRAIPIEL